VIYAAAEEVLHDEINAELSEADTNSAFGLPTWSTSRTPRRTPCTSASAGPV